MDAIKLVLGTTDMNWYRVEQEDFYKEDATLEIKITCKFEKLNEDERGAFLECLSYEDENKKIPCLYLHWTCRYLSSFNPPRPVVNVSTGIEGNGPSPSAEARELLRATYLRALRDAYSEMQAGRHSRLSQIMQHISVVDQGVDEYEEGIDIHNLSIAGIADLSNTLLAKHQALDSINEEMTTILQEKMLLKKDNIRTRLEVTGSNSNKIKKEMTLLEKLDLAVDKDASDMCGRVGLGTSNIMSMACELLLHNEAIGDNKSCFLLIEEPEAHIHAQRQLKLIQSLEEECEKGNRQTIITTHSPLLASVVKLSNIVIVKSGKVYSLEKEQTKLDEDDYLYLEKYLDATKANLFFARSVIIVEGPGEALLLPTLSKLLGCNFTDYGTWNAYEARKANKRTTPKSLIDYFRKGIEEFQNNGEKSEQIEWICKGLRRLVNKAKECNYIPATGNSINAIMKLLSDEQKKDFRKLLMLLADFGNLISKEDWKSMVIIMKKILSLFETEPNEDVKKFGKWVEDQEKSNENSDDKKLLPNYYVYCDEETKREVDMEFGSIHSVKGRTHLDTLVLETFMKSHNMKSILDYLCGEPPKRMKSSSEKRLKCQYVAMTRARALICLAIPIDFVDEKMQMKLQQKGWNLKIV